MRIVTTGGRDFADRELVRWALRLLLPYEVAHGACGIVIKNGSTVDGRGIIVENMRGADRLVEQMADRERTSRSYFPVDHDIDGPWPAAGPRRNQRMLDAFRPDIVLAFDGGRGTADCCRKAKAMSIRVLKAKHDGNVFALEEWRP